MLVRRAASGSLVQPQIEVERGKVVGWPVGPATGFCRLQSWLDDARSADRDFVLKLEDVFKQTVEPVGPEIRAGRRIDKLRADAHAAAGFANRTFENVAHSQFTPDPLHVDRLALVCKAGIAGDDE
jgi:hypothetical protein